MENGLDFRARSLEWVAYGENHLVFANSQKILSQQEERAHEWC